MKNIKFSIVQDNREMRHLILTGKNGSGKTSLIESIRNYLYAVSTSNDPEEAEEYLKKESAILDCLIENGTSENEIQNSKKRISNYQERIERARCGLDLSFSIPRDSIKAKFENRKFILAYFGANRKFESVIPKNVEKITLKDNYPINANVNKLFISYLLDMKISQALAVSNNVKKKSEEIECWFLKLQDILRDIYEDDTLEIHFDIDTYQFSLYLKNREPFGFNQASDGFSAILDIVVNLMFRMQKKERRETDFQVPGIVLIDEIENHLHLALQKRVLPILTELFPNIQFIVTTHSPFVLNSISDATIYDLEYQKLILKGLADASYSGIVEGYFNQDTLSSALRQKIEEYRQISQKDELTDDDFIRRGILESELEEIPDYLDIGISTEYRRLKTEMELREANRK